MPLRFKKHEIDKIIANLLVDEEKLGQWHSPKGVFPRKRESITLNLNRDEYWVICHMAKRKGLLPVNLVKLIIAHYYFNTEVRLSTLMKYRAYIGKKGLDWLYKIGRMKVQEAGEDYSTRRPKASTRPKPEPEVY